MKLTLLDRYFGAAVVRSTVMTLLVLAGVEVVFALVDEMSVVGTGRYGVLDAIAYVGLTVPRRIYEAIPVATLIGALLGLGALSSHGELTPVRAAGWSLTQIAISISKAGLLIALVAIIIGELVAPQAEEYGRTQRDLARSNRVTLQTPRGFWVKDGESFVHIRGVLPGARLTGITIYEFDKGKTLRSATFARAAKHRDAGWVLEGVRLSVFEDTGVTTRTRARLPWKTVLDPGFLAVAIVKPKNLSILDLYQYIRYQSKNNVDSSTYELALWQRVLKPLATAVMVLIAVPFTFGPLRSVSMGTRLVVGVVVGFGFYMLNLTAGHVSLVYGLHPLVGAAAPSLLVTGLALQMLRSKR